jgi:hypothetical protein
LGQLEQLFNLLGVFRLVGDSNSSTKSLLLESDIAKKRFLEEVFHRFNSEKQIFAIEFYKILNEDLEDFIEKRHIAGLY